MKNKKVFQRHEHSMNKNVKFSYSKAKNKLKKREEVLSWKTKMFDNLNTFSSLHE